MPYRRLIPAYGSPADAAQGDRLTWRQDSAGARQVDALSVGRVAVEPRRLPVVTHMYCK